MCRVKPDIRTYIHEICVFSSVCVYTWVWGCAGIRGNRCACLWVQLTPSRIPQIQQGEKASGVERTARAAQCLVSSALKV